MTAPIDYQPNQPGRRRSGIPAGLVAVGATVVLGILLYRPKVFTRSYGTGVEDFDFGRVGWKVTDLSEAAHPSAPTAPPDPARLYDTSKPGRSNAGHTFGDDLTDVERRAVIEYLKTI